MRLFTRCFPGCGYVKLFILSVILSAFGLFAILTFSRAGPRAMRYMKQPETAVSELKRRGMNKKEKGLALDILKAFHHAATQLGMEYFIYSGTLLGSWRHHSMIPWDDDVDVMVNVTCQKRLLQALSDLKPKYHVYDAYQTRFKLWSNQSKSFSQYPWKWPYLDIQFYTGNLTHIWDIAPEFDYIKYPRDVVFPLHLRPYEGFLLPSPHDGLSMLQLTYPESPAMCMTWFYSHKLEESLENVVEVPCTSLKNTHPFVHRKFVKGRMQETLKLGDKIIHVKNVDEPARSVSDPYSLRRTRRRDSEVSRMSLG